MANFGSVEVGNTVDGTLILVAFKNAMNLFEQQVLNQNGKNESRIELEKKVFENLNELVQLSERYTFSAKDFRVYWSETYGMVTTYIYKLENNIEITELELSDFLNLIDKILIFLINYSHREYLREVKIHIDLIQAEITEHYRHVEQDVERYKRLRSIADNAATENIYDKAVERYRKLEVDYRTMFYLSIGITLLFSILVFSLKVQLVPSFFTNIEFWAIKISLLAVGVTLITYFLKQSTHYQRLADQNYQTQIELQAYPSFMESIPTDEAASVRKELALKYFGREIDGSVHKDMGNLIVDQMKSTTEMVKATTEAIKNLK
ncbi:hypothetical protein [Acinetobacter bereziniae]|uniref:hypothetical protein n=1 Tax=Acinetobacter bereziniae TaxID=106648 RepID=UPI003AF4E75C